MLQILANSLQGYLNPGDDLTGALHPLIDSHHITLKIAQQSPLNLNPQALVTLLEVLTALNLNGQYLFTHIVTFTDFPSANNAHVSTPVTTTASASAPASSSASGEGGAAPAPASLSPVQVPSKSPHLCRHIDTNSQCY